MLALIPARAGSERVPGKNTRLMAGRPMITWSIEAALSSRYIDASVVSTEDATIQKIAREAGAWVPFSRAPGLAESESSMVDVVVDAIDRLREVGEHFDYLSIPVRYVPELSVENVVTQHNISAKFHDSEMVVRFTQGNYGLFILLN